MSESSQAWSQDCQKCTPSFSKSVDLGINSKPQSNTCLDTQHGSRILPDRLIILPGFTPEFILNFPENQCTIRCLSNLNRTCRHHFNHLLIDYPYMPYPTCHQLHLQRVCLVEPEPTFPESYPLLQLHCQSWTSATVKTCLILVNF